MCFKTRICLALKTRSHMLTAKRARWGYIYLGGWDVRSFELRETPRSRELAWASEVPTFPIRLYLFPILIQSPPISWKTWGLHPWKVFIGISPHPLYILEGHARLRYSIHNGQNQSTLPFFYLLSQALPTLLLVHHFSRQDLPAF